MVPWIHFIGTEKCVKIRLERNSSRDVFPHKRSLLVNLPKKASNPACDRSVGTCLRVNYDVPFFFSAFFLRVDFTSFMGSK